jgi:hypothetical protein
MLFKEEYFINYIFVPFSSNIGDDQIVNEFKTANVKGIRLSSKNVKRQLFEIVRSLTQ